MGRKTVGQKFTRIWAIAIVTFVPLQFNFYVEAQAQTQAQVEPETVKLSGSEVENRVQTRADSALEPDLNSYRIKYEPEVENSKQRSNPLKLAQNPATKANKKSERGLMAGPKAVGGLLMGMTVGVPVRIARDVSHETLRMRDQTADDLAGGDRPDLFSRTVGSYTGMAYGLVSGVIKGSIKGTERAIDCGMRKPFSKESVSLSDPH